MSTEIANTQMAKPVAGDLLVESASTTGSIVGAEIDSQIATAKQFPRDALRFKRECEQMACVDQETAGTMFYALKRKNQDGTYKLIEGPSIRMAEIVAYCWQNIRTDKRIIAIDDKFVTAQATCMDLERNIATRGECKRRITNKNGYRYSDDMIQVTSQAAMAIALREAVFSVVPRAMFMDIFRKAKIASIGKAGEFQMTVQKMMEWFAKTNGTQEMICEFLGIESTADISQDDIIILRGVVTRMKEEGISAKEALKVESTGTVAPSGVDHVAEAAKKKEQEDKEKSKEKVAEASNAGPEPNPEDVSQEEAMLQELHDSLKRKKTAKGVEEARAEFMAKASTQEQFDLIHELCDIRLKDFE